MAKSKWEQYKEKNGSTPLDFLNPQTRFATKELEEKRMSICMACPEIISITKQCRKCGCFMSAKSKIEVSKCPMGKW